MNNELDLSFDWVDDFEPIRSFNDDDVIGAISELMTKTDFIPLVSQHLNCTAEAITTPLSLITTIDEFQTWVSVALIPSLSSSYHSLTVSGLNTLDKTSPYIFISNHHDIIMDPLLINISLMNSSFKTAHCAIGDNLLAGKTSTLLAKLNNCFRVLRSLSSPRAMFKAMKVQSSYIAYLHFNKQQNIWIAQKEGRSKDKVDLTNPALIKMLALARPKSTPLDRYLEALKIVPVAISYEWDPCDIDKSKQLLEEASGVSFQKSESDDLQAMEKGLFGHNGRIEVSFGEPISANGHTTLNHYDIANRVDAFIHANSKLFPSHYVAYQTIEGQLPPDCPYNNNELSKAKALLDERLDNESENVMVGVYTAYAAPVKSKLGEFQAK